MYVDTDGDGTADCMDQCVTDRNKVNPGYCGCGVVDPVGITTVSPSKRQA